MPIQNINIKEILTPFLKSVTDLKGDADKIFISPKGEDVLVQLLEAQKQIEEVISEAKKKLEAKALSVNPNFTSIQADKIKVYYRTYGQKFYVDENNINYAPKELYTAESKITYKIDSKAVEKWVDAHGGMPTGIVEVERTKTLSFSLKNGAKDENE